MKYLKSIRASSIYTEETVVYGHLLVYIIVCEDVNKLIHARACPVLSIQVVYSL